MNSLIDISWWQLACFMSILLVPLVINWRFELGLSATAGVAIVRMAVQLILVGLYLQFLFELNNPVLNLAWLMLMMVIGASAIVGGAKLQHRRFYWPVFAGLVCGLVPLLSILLLWLLNPMPSFNAQYLIPLAGMLLGNSLSGNIVALQHLFNGLANNRLEYESALALGATPPQATKGNIQAALKQSLTPSLASMATTGLVTLPGMMTGQILSGANPMTAIKYQLVIMVAIFVMLSVSISISLVLSVRHGIDRNGKILTQT